MFARSAPESQFPTARDAIDRMRDTYACSRGVGGEAKIDYFGDDGRVRGSVLFKASRPESVRFDVYSPFGAIISTLTSDGQKFSLYDLQNKLFLHGPASTCNVARFTRVPVPPHALVTLLGGEAPVLVHGDDQASIAWSCGAYVINVASKHEAKQEIRLVPLEADWEKPWNQQRVLVEEVTVTQQGYTLYHAELRDHRTGKTAKGIPADPEMLLPPTPPSGPQCSAPLPRAVRLDVPDAHDLILSHKDVEHNPPITEGNYTQNIPNGVRVQKANCR